MRMSPLLATLLLLCGCAENKPKPPTTVVEAPKVEIVVVNKREFRKLLRACTVAQVPEDLNKKPLEDVAVDLANARKAALVECNKRLQKAREKLGG